MAAIIDTVSQSTGGGREGEILQSIEGADRKAVKERKRRNEEGRKQPARGGQVPKATPMATMTASQAAEPPTAARGQSVSE